jgi:type I restriction enzyme S subunit
MHRAAFNQNSEISILEQVEESVALSDQLETRLAKARGQEDQLAPSLLARAFAGKLVPQDPWDEPAEELIKRVCQRDATGNREPPKATSIME